MPFKLRNIISVSFFVAVLLLMSYCGNDEHTSSNSPTDTLANTYLNHSDTAKYVGMDQCKLCHQDIYNSFIETGMGKSFDVASKKKSSAKFDKHTVIYDKFSDFYYQPFWKNDSMMIMEFRLEGKDTVYKRIEKVDYIIGSGQHTNSHMQSVNGYFNQMPMTYYTQQGKWDLPPGFENGFNTRFSRKIGLECMSCHNSLPNFVEGSENKYSSVPNGITCERCHGPGSIHIQQRSTGSKVDTAKYIDYSIVNPGKLPVDLQFDVCQRCHLQGNAVLKPGKSFYDFRPGMKLSDYMTTFLPRYEGADDEFIMASHADRLKQSKCFISSFKEETDKTSLRPYKNALTCVTCHNPHVSVKATETNVFNNACNKCHGGKDQIVCSEKKEVLLKKENNCVSCHMPRSGSIDIPHVTVHDHYIRKPVKKEEIAKVKKFIGLYAVNEKNPDNITKAKAYLQQYDKFEYKVEYLDSAMKYLQEKDLTSIEKNFDLLVHIYFTKQNFSKVIELSSKIGKEKLLNTVLVKRSWDNQHAWTLYRIGESYYKNGDINNAYSYFKKATELAPFNPEFNNKLGVSLLAQNKVKEAISIFESTLAENPKFVPAISNLGYASLVSGNVLKAEQLYNKGLSLDPDYEMLLMNVAGLYIYKKDLKQAELYLKKVIKKYPENQQAKDVLKQLKVQK
ncbi:MAG: tetratricopeptide repeat protein [Bacteroidia bacterium]|nr:tetratricopeptide repeat protein [Bacteroidia bacterium]